MIAPLFLLVLIAVAVAVVRYLMRQPTPHALWRASLTLGAVVGVVRGLGAAAGWYWTEHSQGGWQIAGFALAMLAWPEAALLDMRRVTPARPGFYLLLAVTLVVTTIGAMSVIALLLQLRRAAARAR
jgi:hypothetical protein